MGLITLIFSIAGDSFSHLLFTFLF